MKMKLKELMDVCMYPMELHSSKDGSLVASTKKSLEKYGEVEVMAIIPKMKMDKNGTHSQSYLYVYGNSIDIRNIKQEELPF